MPHRQQAIIWTIDGWVYSLYICICLNWPWWVKIWNWTCVYFNFWFVRTKVLHLLPMIAKGIAKVFVHLSPIFQGVPKINVGWLDLSLWSSWHLGLFRIFGLAGSTVCICLWCTEATVRQDSATNWHLEQKIVSSQMYFFHEIFVPFS